MGAVLPFFPHGRGQDTPTTPTQVAALTYVPATFPARPEVPEDCPLTARQYEILYWITQGKEQKEVAHLLGLSHSAVRTHCHYAYKLLGVPSATAATVMFMRKGWHAEETATPSAEQPQHLDHSAYAGLPAFAPAYLNALDRHLADGDDKDAARDMSVAMIGLTARKPATRDREAFLDTIIDALHSHTRHHNGKQRRPS